MRGAGRHADTGAPCGPARDQTGPARRRRTDPGPAARRLPDRGRALRRRHSAAAGRDARRPHGDVRHAHDPGRASSVAADPMVGTVRARLVGDTAHVARLAVRPAPQGHGIGRRLLVAIERAVAPVDRYELFTGHRSERNLRLYARAGYRRMRTVRESDRVSLIFLEKVVANGGAR
ncbi:MAG TPA: GNAT family N-acetyltransferase [Euzebyales bacterium]|nr:GNAT family N-acetyltransferase [Euzebyales bacterium]